MVTKDDFKSPFGGTCETCPHWLAKGKQKMIATTDGQFIPAASIALQGLPAGARMVGGTQEVAPCTFNPQWHPAPADHWCSQHPALAPRLEIVLPHDA